MKVYQSLGFAVSILYYSMSLALIVYLYARIMLTLRQRIRNTEMLNAIRVDISDDELLRFSTSDPDFIDNVFDHELKVERSYFTAISVSAFISLPLLFMQFAFGLYIKGTLIMRGELLGDFNTDKESVGGIVMLDFFSAMYILNPLIFYFTNEDFKIKINRPIREIRRILCKSPNTSMEVYASNSTKE